MTCFIFLMLNITNDNKSNTEEHYSALFPVGFLHSGQNPKTLFMIFDSSALFFKHRSEVLRDFFSKQSFFRLVESTRRSALPVPRTYHHVLALTETHTLCCIELPTGFFCVSWRLLASHCLTTSIEGDVKCGCKHWPHFNVKLIVTNSTACYWSAKFICFIVPLPKRRALTNCHFRYTYRVSIMHNPVFLTVTLSCRYNIHAHHMLQFV